MAKTFNKFDFYFGSILSVLLSGKHTRYAPSLISSDNKSGRIYEFSVNDEPDFILIMTYAAQPQTENTDKEYNSWQLPFNKEQREKIKECIDTEKKIKIACLCGKTPFYESELALMDNEDISQTVYQNGKVKSTVTVSRKKGKHYYSVFRGKSPKDAYPLKAQLPRE